MSTVSVIIPTWNGCERLSRCLESLHKQTRLSDQTIVVDNASTDGTAKFIQDHYPWIHLVSLPKNQGTAGGTNAGVRVATGDHIVILNNDAYPTPTWLEALLHAQDQYQEYAFAASCLLLADGSNRIDTAGQGLDPRLGGVMIGHGEPYGPTFDRFREVFCADHAAAIYRREVFETVGELDESLFMYSDDVDLGFRARLCGYRCLYVPDALVYHERSGTIGNNSPTQVRFIYRNMLTVYLKNMPWPLMRETGLQTLRLLAGMLHHAPHHGAALLGVLEALWRLPNTLRKRQRIQRTRAVAIEQLHAAMTAGVTSCAC